MKIDIPHEIKDILVQLNSNGFKVYAVGGCIRDTLLGIEPKDWDICTNAIPNEVKKVFQNEKIIDTGLKHGTVTLVRNNIPYEITTFRADGNYSDGRHPDSVSFVSSLQEDLSRRDFTINALAADKTGSVIDCFNGVNDLKNNIIRCVGNPYERFGEDALRILRALRFSAKYYFRIDENTSKAIHSCCHLIKNVSAERITAEFCKIIKNSNSNLLMEFSDVISEIVPEVTPCIGFNQNNSHHIFDVYQHSVKAIEFAQHNLELRLSLFFHDIGKPETYIIDEKGVGHFPNHAIVGAEMTEKIMKRMRFDNITIRNVVELVKYHDTVIQTTPAFVRRLLNKYGNTQSKQLINVVKCDKRAQSQNKDSERTLKDVSLLSEIIKKEISKKHCFSLKNLAVNGEDIKCLGVKEGPNIGKILKRLLAFVLNNPGKNQKDILLAEAKKIITTL